MDIDETAELIARLARRAVHGVTCGGASPVVPCTCGLTDDRLKAADLVLAMKAGKYGLGADKDG